MPKTPVMLAKDLNPKKLDFPVAIEDKLDGIRIYFKNGQGWTRLDHTYDTLTPIAEVLTTKLDDGEFIDAEVVGSNWNETTSLIKRKHDVDHPAIKKNITINVFDYTWVNDDASYKQRRLRLEGYFAGLDKQGFKIKLVKSKIVKNQDQLEAAFQDALTRGKEGIMIKALDGIYEMKRSYAWMKLKPFKDVTMTITGFVCGQGLCPECSMKKSTGDKITCELCEGTGNITKPNILGKFLCDYEGEEVGVGGGFTALERIEFWAMKDELLGTKIDAKLQDDKVNDITARHPVFMRRRFDV